MKSYTTLKEKWTLCALTVIFGCIIMLFSYTYNQNNSNLTLLQSIVITTTTTTTTTSTTTSSPSEEEEQKHQVAVPFIDEKLVLNATKNDIIEEEEETCDFFEGSWVYKPESNPLYNVLQCPFLSLQVSCQNNGRPDFEYEHWTWEPKAKACLIPKFDGLDMLERLRNKRVIIVGDSLNRNQWESLACLLYSVLPPTRTTVDIESEFYKVFRSEDYNCTVEFYWSPFLVQLDESKGKGKIVLRLDKLDEASKKWEGADIMVFNGGHCIVWCRAHHRNSPNERIL